MLENREGNLVVRVCDECGDKKTVNYWNVYKKSHHTCHSCANKKTNIGRQPWNKGKKMKPKNIGNIYIQSDGYPQVWVGRTNMTNGYMGAHRLVMSDSIGRVLTDTEKVHHINGDKADFRLDNLFLCEDMSHHRKVHAQLEQLSMALVQAGVIKFTEGEYVLSRPMKKFVEETLGELLETPTEKDGDNQQPSSEELAEKVQRLFREEVEQESARSAQP